MIALNEIVRQYPGEMQKPEFYDQMVKEYIHHYMLQILFSCNHAEKINFLGGTALRYFYDIKRFSEDLDFDCFNFTKEEFVEMTDKVEKELKAFGYDVFIEDKNRFEALKAFRRVFVFPELKYKLGLTQQREAKFFIKIEAEPHNFSYKAQIKTLNGFGVITPVRLVPPDILFSSKIAAAVKRKKDRDFFDVICLIDFIKPNFKYLAEKCNIKTAYMLKKSLLKAAEERKLDTKKTYDCEHMLFDKKDIQKIKTFALYIKSFDFKKFE